MKKKLVEVKTWLGSVYKEVELTQRCSMCGTRILKRYVSRNGLVPSLECFDCDTTEMQYVRR